MCQVNPPASARSTESTVDPAPAVPRSAKNVTGLEERASSAATDEIGSDSESAFSEKSRSAASVIEPRLPRWITSSHFAGSMTLCDWTETTSKGCANRVTAERQLQKMADLGGASE